MTWRDKRCSGDDEDGDRIYEIYYSVPLLV
jgi:hypothetical protein